jgi:radical SAM superfamily enzyme YgiQ (UPF0313 family)
MKVVLINLPDMHSLDPMLDPPLGLMYHSSALKINNIDCKIIDLSLYPQKEWFDVIKSNPADLYGITVYTPSVYTAYSATTIIKYTHPNAKVVWGGPHPTFSAIDISVHYPKVDFVIFGEGEQTLLELCQKFDSPYKHGEIMGLANRQDKMFFISNMRPLIRNLDELPPPERNSDFLHNYTRKVDDLQATSIMTSRGCYGSCNFCDSKFYWKYPRQHSVQRVAKELDELQSLDYQAFYAWDDIFTTNHYRLYQILDEIKKRKMIFRCNGDLRLDTKEVLQKLKDSGCREICFGIESGDQRILNIMNKKMTVERNKEVLKWAKEVGIPVKAFLMVGSPGESSESVKNTIEFIKETGPEFYTIFNFTPLPGSEFYNNPEKYKIKFRTKDYRQFFNIGGQNIGGLPIDTEFMTAEEIAEARKMMIAELPKQKGKLQDYYKKVKA